MIRTTQAHIYLEANTTGPTLALVIEALAAEGEGDVEVYRVDLTSGLTGPANAEKRRLLRDVFTA